jgi:hypothetical protein
MHTQMQKLGSAYRHDGEQDIFYVVLTFFKGGEGVGEGQTCVHMKRFGPVKDYPNFNVVSSQGSA